MFLFFRYGMCKVIRIRPFRSRQVVCGMAVSWRYWKFAAQQDVHARVKQLIINSNGDFFS